MGYFNSTADAKKIRSTLDGQFGEAMPIKTACSIPSGRVSVNVMACVPMDPQFRCRARLPVSAVRVQALLPLYLSS